MTIVVKPSPLRLITVEYSVLLSLNVIIWKANESSRMLESPMPNIYYSYEGDKKLHRAYSSFRRDRKCLKISYFYVKNKRL